MSGDMLIAKRKDDRDKFLKWLYDISGADELKWGAFQQIGDDIGVSADEAATIAQYLASKDYIQWRTIGGGIGITRRGIDAIERGVVRASQATSVITNILNIGTMTHSQIQQGTVGSSQSMTISGPERDEITRALEEVRGLIVTLPLSPGQQADVEGNAATVEAQLRASKPNRRMIREALDTIAAVLAPFADAATVIEALLKLAIVVKVAGAS